MTYPASLILARVSSQRAAVSASPELSWGSQDGACGLTSRFKVQMRVETTKPIDRRPKAAWALPGRLPAPSFDVPLEGM
jgi:hypothetical protein